MSLVFGLKSRPLLESKTKSNYVDWKCIIDLCTTPAVYGARRNDQKSSKLGWLYHQLLSEFLANGHLLQVSCLWANDKGDKDMMPNAVHTSFTAGETPEKPR